MKSVHTIAVGIVTLLTVFGAERAPAQSIQIGTAANAIGHLIVIRPDGIQETLSGQGSVQLFEGDVLTTEPASQALIEFNDGVQVVRNENTAFKILSRWQKGKPPTRIIRVKQGEVWVKTGDGPKQFEVETPVATASVRETEFNMKVQQDGQSTLTVIQGIVEFGGPFNTWRVRPSTMSYAIRGKKCTEPAPTDVAPIIAWINPVRQTP